MTTTETPAYAVGQEVQFKTHDGNWYRAVVVTLPSRDTGGDYILDAASVEYRAHYVTRPEAFIRPYVETETKP